MDMKEYKFTGDVEKDASKLTLHYGMDVEKAYQAAQEYSKKYGDMGLVKETLKKAK
jgi:hypothetical protein